MKNTAWLNPYSTHWPWFWRSYHLIGAAFLLTCLAFVIHRQDFSNPLADRVIFWGISAFGLWILGLWIRLLTMRYHGFRVIEQTTQIVFKLHDATTATVTVYESGLYQALLDQQNRLHNRKYVHQPATMSGETLLSNLNYKVGVADDDSTKNHAIAAQADLHEARALNVTFHLPRTLSEGERIRLSESFEFKSALFQPQKSLLFPVFLPTGRRRIILLFEGVYPEEINVEVFDAMGGGRPIPVPFAETETGARRGIFDWPRPKPGQEARISWNWSPSTVETAKRHQSKVTWSTEMAGRTLAERLMKSTLAGDAATDAAAADTDLPSETEGQSAEDHPLIKAARARLGVPYKEE